jgi:4'-phosphopantetheinyl transferase
MDPKLKLHALPAPDDNRVQLARADTAWRGPAIELNAGHVDLWIMDKEHLETQGERLTGCLSPDERARAQRLVRAEDQRTFILFRGALRSLLARYVANSPPGSLCFSYGPHGKPELCHPQAIRFNLTHSGGRLAIAVSHHAVGVDLEQMERTGDLEAVSARFYAPAETAALERLAPTARRALFFRWWTAKEATLKAWGIGLGSEKDYPDFSRWTQGSSARIKGPSAERACEIHAFPEVPHWAGAVATVHALERLTVRDVTGWWTGI